MRNLLIVLLLTSYFTTLFSQISTTPSTLLIKQVNFENDQASLNNEVLADFLLELQALKFPTSAYRAFLVGHTDNKGSLEYNQDLSRRRAEGIRDILVQQGIPQTRIELEYKAYLAPLDKTENDNARAKNRRVDIILEPWENTVSKDFITINNEEGGTLQYSRSDTKINIPPDALCYPDGKPFKGEAIITYREFRDYADFMMTNIPMNFEWEGGDAYFESSGMFELRAISLDNEPLAITSNKTIDIAFEQTQVIEETTFWNYDETKRTWQSGNPFIEYTDVEIRSKKVRDDIRKLGYFSSKWYDRNTALANKNITDITKSLQEAHTILIELVEKVKRDDYLAFDDSNSFRERFRGRETRQDYAGTTYIGHLSFKEVYKNPDYYNIKLEEVSLEEGTPSFTIQNLSSTRNPELEFMEDIVWSFSKKDFEQKYDADLFTRLYDDIRIKTSKEKKYDFDLLLKYKNELITLPLQILQVANGDEMTTDVIANKYKKYRRAYRARESQLATKIELEKDRIRHTWQVIQLLLPKYIGDDGSYYAMGKLMYKSRRISPNKRLQRGLTHTPFDRLANFVRVIGNENNSYLEILYKERIEGKSLSHEEWKQRIGSYRAKVYQVTPIYENVYIQFEKPTPTLKLKGLGVFNLDVLKRFTKAKKILAQYQTEKGKALEVSKIEVINHALNGLLRFREGESIYLDLENPTTVVVHTTKGEVYYLGPKEIQDLELHDKESIVFKMKPLGDYVAKPDLIRGLIAGVLTAGKKMIDNIRNMKEGTTEINKGR